MVAMPFTRRPSTYPDALVEMLAERHCPVTTVTDNPEPERSLRPPCASWIATFPCHPGSRGGEIFATARLILARLALTRPVTDVTLLSGVHPAGDTVMITLVGELVSPVGPFAM